MIKDLMDEFHRSRLAQDRVSAMKVIKQLQAQYSFSTTDLVTALVEEDFLEKECLKYLKELEECERSRQ